MKSKTEVMQDLKVELATLDAKIASLKKFLDSHTSEKDAEYIYYFDLMSKQYLAMNDYALALLKRIEFLKQHKNQSEEWF